MRHFSGTLNGLGWDGYVVERPEDLEPFRDWIRRQAESRTPVAVDTETCGLKIYAWGPGFLRLAQFGNETEAWALPIEHGAVYAEAAVWALRILPDITGHNWAGFDALVCDEHLGVPLEETCAKATDTKILAKLIDPRAEMEGGIGQSLKPLSAHYIDASAPDTQDGLKSVFKDLKLKIAEGFAKIPLSHPTYLEYGLLDVILTSRLRPRLERTLAKLGVPQRLSVYEHRVARICAQMVRAGMVLDEEYTTGLQADLSYDADQFAEIALRYGVESVNSGRQVSAALLDMGESLTEKTASGAWKVDKAVLMAIADLDRDWKAIGSRPPNALADAVLRSKRAGKWRSAYADNFLENVDARGRIHPNIQSMQARTFRMSVTQPAVQTLPSSDKMIRRALLADEGHVMISTDFQAVELRVLAALADVKRMKLAIANGEDLHSFTARLVFGEGFTDKDRKVSKGIAFGKVYGGGATTVARQTGAPIDAVQRAMAKYDQVYPEVGRAAKDWRIEAFNNRMVAVSITGHRLPLDRDRTYAVTNYLVQSTARDCLGQALIHMDERGLVPFLRLPIHDEVLASAPKEDAKDIARAISECMTFDLLGVPIAADAEIGKRSWGSLYGADF
ncbi:DNA polymerase [Streptomyces viridochromogenes]|uniref:DNA polymerase n=1 Tax=Streptomyces viridochromogenes TaxID=1938 RepID=UPI00069F4577|nr:DNA polymerase [Streptomyces viridochromogenes]KOG22018.1 DNA polymerase [Streptomyces viridochromogenes]